MHTIHASLDHPDATPGNRTLYCFTDPTAGLVGEPLMEEATEVISCLFIYSERQPGPVAIHFTADEAEAAGIDESIGFCCILTNPRPARDGTDYELEVVSPDPIAQTFNGSQAFLGHFLRVWLCPALLRYFPAVPEVLYVQIVPEG